MITITTAMDAAREGHNYDYVISILDVGGSMAFKDFPNFGANHKLVRFEDTEHPSEEELLQMTQGVSSILQWADIKRLDKDSNILVHCYAGVSRSSAIAWLLLVKFGMSYREAFQNLYTARPRIDPNLAVMSIGDTILGQHGALLKEASIIAAEIHERKQSYLGYGG